MSGLTYHYRHYDGEADDEFILHLPITARNALLILIGNQFKDKMDAIGLSDAEQNALRRVAASLQ